MPARYKILFYLSLAILGAQGLYHFIWNLPEYEKAEEMRLPEQIMYGVKLFEKAGDKKSWELYASKAEAFADTKEWNLFEVNVIFYGEDFKYNVKGDSAVVNTNNMDLQIQGTVSLETETGYLLTSDLMTYDSEKKKINSPSRTKVSSPKDQQGQQMFMEADRIFTDLSVHQIVAESRVVTQKQEGQDLLQIFSENAVIHLDTDIARYYKGLRILFQGSTITGELADFIYDANAKLFTDVIVQGNVVLKEANRQANAGKMTVNIRKETVHLQENPRVIQDGDELLGKEIFLLERGNQIKVIGAKAQIEDALEKKK